MAKSKVIFLVLPHVHLMDLAGPDQVFLEAIGFGAEYEMVYCSNGQTADSSSHLPFGKLQHFEEVSAQSGDFLFIPGCELAYFLSDEFKAGYNLFAWIRKCYDGGATLASICSGAFALAQTGLLDGRPCTTHWKRTRELQQWFPKVQVVENVLFTEDDRIYTSAGIASGIDLALYLLEQRKGEWFAHQVAREMVIYTRRSGRQQQQSEWLSFRNHIHTGIHHVQDWLHEHLDTKMSLDELADKANMSTRNFTRIFKKETSLTVNQYISRLRKERISQLMKNPNLSRAEIARRCGLKSERQLGRLIRGKG